MNNSRERLIQWLRDAHAMEEQAETMLSTESGRLEHYPELRIRIAEHLDETRQQTVRLRECLTLLGSDPSAIKDAVAKTTTAVMGFFKGFAGDEVMKTAMAAYTFEHYEISAYTILIAAASECNEQQVVGILSDIRSEEEAMADWLLEHMPIVTGQYLVREESGMTAKR